MKRQIQNKIFDLCAQLACALLPLAISLYMDEDGMLFSSYFTVGICQLISFAANNAKEEKMYQVAGRDVYGSILRIIFIGGIISLISLATPVGMIALGYLFIMLFVGVVMAIFYFGITIAELRKLIAAQSKLNNVL